MKQPLGKPPVKPSQTNTPDGKQPGLKQAKTTRRGFLEISAAAVAGLTLSPLAQSSPLATSASASSMTSTSAQAPATGSGSQGIDLPSLTLVEAAARIRQKQISPVELIQAVLDRIAALEPKVGAFITVVAEEALEAARRAEQEIQQGSYRGPLHGIPVGFKDTFYTRGIRTTAATAVLQNFVPDFDATIVRRLKEAGAIVIGKTNLPEFSFGGFTAGTNNPWDLSRNAGGSSGGSGAALAASFLLGATGGDTSGSIRNPASTCGVVGHKPTFGVVSRYGVVPISWTLDHLGPMAKRVEDCAILLKAIAGYDPNDRYSARVPVPDYPALLRRNVRGMQLGMPPSTALADFHPDTLSAFRRAVQVMESLGAEVREVTLPPSIHVASAAQRIIRISDAATYHRQYLLTRADLYGADNPAGAPVSRVRSTVEAGSLLTAAQYLRAQQVRKVFISEMLQLYEPLDAFLTPTMPAPAGETANPAITFRAEFNVLGFPAISVPAGFSTAPPGLPIGLQISGKPFQDAVVLALAYAYESATDWHQRQPAL
ncbi:MAG: amidase [Acidobacteria bacterium]|nr:amidase [Acidobacteriota bacterium]